MKPARGAGGGAAAEGRGAAGERRAGWRGGRVGQLAVLSGRAQDRQRPCGSASGAQIGRECVGWHSRPLRVHGSARARSAPSAAGVHVRACVCVCAQEREAHGALKRTSSQLQRDLSELQASTLVAATQAATDRVSRRRPRRTSARDCRIPGPQHTAGSHLTRALPCGCERARCFAARVPWGRGAGGAVGGARRAVGPAGGARGGAGRAGGAPGAGAQPQVSARWRRLCCRVCCRCPCCVVAFGRASVSEQALSLK